MYKPKVGDKVKGISFTGIYSVLNNEIGIIVGTEGIWTDPFHPMMGIDICFMISVKWFKENFFLGHACGGLVDNAKGRNYGFYLKPDSIKDLIERDIKYNQSSVQLEFLYRRQIEFDF
jgi:hypothetical protein